MGPLLLQRGWDGPHMMGGAGWWWLVVLLFWLAVIALIVWAVRTGRDGTSAPDPNHDARRILAERYARGEIDADEYRERLEVLA